MSSKYPKYITVKNSKDLMYQRRIPTKIRDSSGVTQQVFLRSMGLTVGASEKEISKALTKCHEMYDLRCNLLTNSSPDALSESDLDIAAAELLRKLNKRIGSLLFYSPNGKKSPAGDGSPMSALEEASLSITGTFDGLESLYYLEKLIKEKVQVEDQAGNSHELALTTKEEVELRAAKKLLEASEYKPKTFSGLFVDYISFRGLELTGSNNKKTKQTQKQRMDRKVIKRIEKFLACLGEQYVTDKAGPFIQAAMKNYCYERMEKGKVTPATVSRELSDIKSFINYAINEYSLNWTIRAPNLPAYSPKQRLAFTEEEQIQIVGYILNTENINHVLGCICLLQLQGGLMTSEIKHIDISEGNLSNEKKVPYIVANHEQTKTKARKRIVPIVIGLEYIREHLPKAIEWLNRTTDSSHSVQVKMFLRAITGNPHHSGHCFRHSLRNNILVNEVDMFAAANIAGWSGKQIGMSEHMMKYGLSGIEDKAVLKRLYKTSQEIHKHLLQSEPDDSNYNNSNVISFNTANL